MDKLFRLYTKLRGGSAGWTDNSPASIIINNEFFEIASSITIDSDTGILVLNSFEPTITVTNNITVNTLPSDLLLEGFRPNISISVNSATNSH